MNQPVTSVKPNILIAPLDWGLGHATRCIPIINSLLSKGAGVILAGEGKTRNLLEKEFPELPFIHLEGYNITYSDNKWTLPFVLASQIPKIISAIQNEQEWLYEITAKYKIDGIISDNRYGLYHHEIPCIFITHQLLIKTGWGSITDLLLQEQNYGYVNKFTECWVPDNLNPPNYAGELSHPKNLPEIPLKYIGPLSRFNDSSTQNEIHILIILSGPEPQRTKLEEMLLDQLQNYKGAIVFIRGLPGEDSKLDVPAHISVFNHLPAQILEEKINQASYVISRCGYSTVMDLSVLKKKSILIPTPGQTEQEYLAEELLKNNFALCVEQQKFKLKNILELAHSFNYRLDHLKGESNLDEAIMEFLNQVDQKKKASN
ncbi:MAG: glycosyltransferase [Flavisolibacter sp.]